jgi:hypothetical protein
VAVEGWGTAAPDAILRGVPSAGLSSTSGQAIITFAIARLLVPPRLQSSLAPSSTAGAGTGAGVAGRGGAARCSTS